MKKIKANETVKKTLVVVLVMVLTSLMTCVFLNLSVRTPIPEETHKYSMKGVVLNPNYIETEDDNLWECDTKFDKGVEVIVTFDDNGTTDVRDDEIIRLSEF